MILTVFNEFQKRLGDLGQVVIAGGAVRDWLMKVEPKDYDVFVLHDSTAKFEELKQSVVERVSDLSTIPPVVEWHNSEPFLTATVDFMGKQVQILGNPAPSIDALVDTFDWNVCLFALGDDQFVAKEQIENIKPGADLRLNRVTFPGATLRRGFRFSERFKMKIKPDDLKLLCRRVAGIVQEEA